MIRPVTYYQAVCDRCGTTHDGYEYSAWSDQDGAEAAAEGSDWWIEGGNHLCFDCQPHEPDWDEHHDRAANSVEPLNCEWCQS